ncbi:AFG1 family ATPase [Oligella ureolytica]
MILHRLLEKLFDYGCTFVMTSNYEPSTLYPDGLHRDWILPAIALIKKKMDIINVDTGIDYRRRTLEQVQLYYRPLTAENRQAMESLYKQISGEELKEEILTIENRPMKALGVAGTVSWFDFKTLCEDNRSQNDFLN